jgi:hypothetical protein
MDTDLYRAVLTADLSVVVDKHHGVLLEISDAGHGMTRVAVPDPAALTEHLAEATATAELAAAGVPFAVGEHVGWHLEPGGKPRTGVLRGLAQHRRSMVRVSPDGSALMTVTIPAAQLCPLAEQDS